MTIDRFLSLLLGVSLIAIWEWMARAWHWSQLVLPAPSRVLQSLSSGWTTGYFQPHIMQTLVEVVAGWCLGSCIGFLVGVLFAESSRCRQILLPYLVTSQVVPKLALGPLLMLWLGFGTLPLVVISALVCFFPLFENTLTSMRHIDSQNLDLFRLMNASKWQTLWLLKVPSGLPEILAGLRVSMVLAWVGAVVGEFVGATRGLGALIIAAQGSMDTPLMFAVLILITLLGWVSYQALLVIEQQLLKNREPMRRESGLA